MDIANDLTEGENTAFKLYSYEQSIIDFYKTFKNNL